MKKFAAILIALVLVGMTPVSTSAMNMGVGIKAGLNMASISGTGESKTKMGLAALALLDMQFSDMFGAQIELGYVMNGAKASEGDGSLSLNYLAIPLLFKIILPVPAVNPYIIVGPSIGILMAATESDGTNDRDVKAGFAGTDFGLAFGAGVNIPMGLIVELRYTLGLSKLDKDGNGDNKNGAFAIMAGWEFKI
jgi:hypothetical protein